MGHPGEPFFSYTSVQSLLDADDFERLVHQVLDDRDNLPEPFASDLDQALRAANLKGVRSQHSLKTVSTDRLVRPVLRRLQADGKQTELLYAALLSAWVASQPSLSAEVTQFLVGRGISPREIRLNKQGFQDWWDLEEVFDLASSFLTLGGSYRLDHVALMLCCLTGRAPLEQETMQEIKIISGSLDEADDNRAEIDEWLNQLSALPASLPAWDDGLAFVADVRQLAQEKKERRQIELDVLRQAVDDLKELREWFAYFHLDEVDDWPSRISQVEFPETLGEQVRVLSEQLSEYAILHTKYPNPTFSGDLRIQRQQFELGRKIQAHYEQLADAFKASRSLTFDIRQTLPFGTNNLVWEDWLSILIDLPAGHPFWVSVDGICENLAHVIQTKQSTVHCRTRLADALSSLQSFAELFPYFGIDEVQYWSIENCVADELEDIAASIDALADKLAFFQELRSMQASSFVEEQAQHEQQRQTGDEIVALYSAVRNSFVSPFTETDEKVAEEAPLSDGPAAALEADVIETDETGMHEPVAPGPEFEAETEIAPEAIIKEGTASGISDDTLNSAVRAIEDEEVALFWQMVAEGDLAGAYWMARSMAVSRQSPAPDWLLGAVQAARWLHRGYNLSVQSYLTQLVRSQKQPGNSDTEALLGLAAALRPTLFAPSTGLIGWLSVPRCCPEFHLLVTSIQQFANFNIALGPNQLLDIANEKKREQAVVDAAQNVRRWLDNAPMRRLKYRIADDVWRHLVSKDGSLYELLSPVMNDERERVHEIQAAILERKSDPDRWIDEAQRKLKNPKPRRIVGSTLQSLHRLFEDACRVGLDWCELVIQQQDIADRGDWIQQQVEQLVDNLGQALPPVVESLNNIIALDDRPSVVAAAHAAARAVYQLAGDLRLPGDNLPSLHEDGADWLVQDVDTVEAAFARRLLLLPEIPLTDHGDPVDAALADVAVALERAYSEQRSLSTAFYIWMEKQDFRFAERLLNIVRDELPNADEEYNIRLQGAVAELANQLRDVEESIEQSLIDGIISEEAHSKYSEEVVNVDPNRTRNFRDTYRKLSEQVEKPLERAKEQRLHALQTSWQELELKLPASNIAEADCERIRDTIIDGLSRGDTRIVEEYLSSLREALEKGHDHITAEVDDTDGAFFLEEFLSLHDVLTQAASRSGLRKLRQEIEKDGRISGVWSQSLPIPRREEAAAAIDAWHRLKKNIPSNEMNSKHLAEVLRYLGFAIDTHHSIVRQSSGADGWLYVQAHMHASTQLVRPLPQFGSQRAGLYDVVVVWERPSMDTMSAWLHDLRLTNRAVILFYLGRMKLPLRRYIASAAQEQGLTVATLDEVLLLYLATPRVARSSRLTAFLRCALPFAAVNPYTPYKAGDVPPEMFFGRQDMVRELMKASGSCLVYGGRQLGKSALLRHVQREFHDKDRQQYACVEDIRLVGDPVAGQPVETVFYRVRDRLKEFGLLSEQITTDDPDKICQYVQQTFIQNPHLRLIMMFDEADSFLDADAKDNFVQVSRLREIMVQTDRRFKVIFAGLQDVQRFQGLPNQPLAHFGSPQRVGPLEPRPAQQLIKEPLEAVGYRIDGPSILRILSYTNYHPGLIQLFCHELLRMLHKRADRLDPPYHITQEEVEAVYRSADVRDAIRDRFNLTLALDKRYEAIACAMIVEQIEAHDSYARAYTAGDILRMGQEWWPEGFGEMSSQDIRARLDEMCGLGVLVRDTNGHYRLKSPNLVRLMGTEQDIEDRLLAISELPAPVTFDADSHHTWLDGIFSPFSYSQERSLSQRQFGVGLVFASNALGYQHLPKVYTKWVAGSDDLGVAKRVPQNICTGEDLKEWLDQFLDKNSDATRLVAYYNLTVASEVDLQGLVKSALDYCQRRQHTRSRWLRIVFNFAPSATWQWLSLPRKQREQLEDLADAVVTPARWTPTGIKQRLQHRDVMDLAEVSRSILSATGGWHILVDRLFDEIADTFEPGPLAALAEEFRAQLILNPMAADNFLSEVGLHESIHTITKELQTVLLGEIYRDESELEILVELTRSGLSERGEEIASSQILRVLEYLERLACVSNHVNSDGSRQYVLEPFLNQVLSN